ncbi:MAG: regulatory protein RecX [Gammaproteobacteria bacterium]
MMQILPKRDSSSRKDSPKEAYTRVYNCAMGLLSRREHSISEMYAKLTLRKFDRVYIDDALDTLIEEGALNEARFIAAYIHSRASRGFGPARIQAELRERGISSCDIELATEAVETSWDERATQVRAKRFGLHAPDDFQEKAKQMRFLGQRGFSHEQIRSAFMLFSAGEAVVAS